MKKKLISLSVFILMLFAFATVGHAASLSPSSTSVKPGQTVTVSYSGASGLASSWIGMYETGAGDGSYMTYVSIHTATSGSVQFTMPTKPGNYEFRIFAGGAYSKIGTSAPVSVVEFQPTLSLSSTSLKPGQKVTVSYSGASGFPSSWIGMYSSGATDGSYMTYASIHTATSGVVEFTAPTTVGNYEFRIFKDGGYTKIGTSVQFAVSEFTPALTASPSSVSPSGKVRVNYSGASGVDGSWIGMYKPGTGDGSYLAFQYINKNTSGYLDFTAPSQEGNYEFRIFRGAGYTKIGTGGQFTVGNVPINQTLRGTGLLDGIKLDWDGSTQPGVVGYNLYRGTSSGNYSSTPVTDFFIRELTYTDKTVESGTTYYYIMKPVYSNGTEGAASNEVAVRMASQSGDRKIVLQIDNPMMNVNGVVQEIDPGRGTVPVIVNGRTLLPIRAIIESMGGTIEWEGTAQKVTIRSESNTIEMWAGNKVAYVNGERKELDVPPQIINGRTMVPLRFVGESLDKYIEWEGIDRIVTMHLD
jgi:hypothetical protein